MLKKADLKRAYREDWYTITYAGGDLQEWVDGYNQMLTEEKIGKPVEWYVCKGKDVNAAFGLKGKNALKATKTVLMFPLDGLKISTLAIFKLNMGDHWFSDVIGNAR